MKPCGHAASGDSVDGLRPPPLPPAAWKTLRVSHMPTRPTTAIVQGEEKKLTYQQLSVATLRHWRGYGRDGGGVLSETLAGNAPRRVAGMAGIRNDQPVRRQVLRLAETMERLGYFAVLNGWPKPAEPFRTRPLEDGNIDIAAALGLVWARGYTGPIVSQAYDLGGDAYLTAKRSIDYIREIHDRYQRNPALNPWHKS